MQEEVILKLKDLTKHNAVRITNRGKASIFIALAIAKKVNEKPFLLIIEICINIASSISFL